MPTTLVTSLHSCTFTSSLINHVNKTRLIRTDAKCAACARTGTDFPGQLELDPRVPNHPRFNQG
ncbi:MAG: hypothetical protein ACXADA_17470 [Candidatus Hodarchaeales archaeon]